MYSIPKVVVLEEIQNSAACKSGFVVLRVYNWAVQVVFKTKYNNNCTNFAT